MKLYIVNGFYTCNRTTEYSDGSLGHYEEAERIEPKAFKKEEKAREYCNKICKEIKEKEGRGTWDERDIDTFNITVDEVEV